MAQNKEEIASRRAVRDVMTPNPASVSEKDSIKRVAEIMKREDAGVVPVVDGSKVIGLITDRDIVVRLSAEGKDPAKARVNQALNKQVRTGKEAEYFSIYEIGDKGTSWLGPPTFGIALQLTGSYRIAILSLIIFFIAGLAVLTRANIEQGERDVQAAA